MTCKYCEQDWPKFGAFHINPAFEKVDVMCEDLEDQAKQEALDAVSRAATLCVIARIDFEFQVPPKNRHTRG